MKSNALLSFHGSVFNIYVVESDVAQAYGTHRVYMTPAIICECSKVFYHMEVDFFLHSYPAL